MFALFREGRGSISHKFCRKGRLYYNRSLKEREEIPDASKTGELGPSAK